MWAQKDESFYIWAKCTVNGCWCSTNTAAVFPVSGVTECALTVKASGSSVLSAISSFWTEMTLLSNGLEWCQC